MKKVLIIAYYWRGRIPGLAKYLPEFGWQPVILTAPSPFDEQPASELRIIETPYHDVLDCWKKLFGLNPDEDITNQVRRRLGAIPKKSFVDSFLTLGGEVIGYPDLQRGWKPFAVKAGDELLQNEDIDAIISSFSPATSHLIAKELKIKYKIPWIADLRDLWSQNHNYHYGRLRKFLDRRLELKTLSVADALVTVSPLWAEELRALHKREVVYTITNGFDPDEMNKGQIDLTSKFTITYTGLIYTGKQEPSKLFAALKDLISDGTMDPKDVEVRFYGPEIVWLPSEIEEYGLSNIAKYYGMRPQEIAFEKQRESQILLLLTWEGKEKAGYGIKTFEYLAAQRPILATGVGNCMHKELLDETNAGIYCKTVEDIKSTLRELYSEYKLKDKITYNGDIEKINKYSHREMAKKFAKILNNIT